MVQGVAYICDKAHGSLLLEARLLIFKHRGENMPWSPTSLRQPRNGYGRRCESGAF